MKCISKRFLIGFAHSVCNKKLRQPIRYYTSCAYAHNSQIAHFVRLGTNP